MVNLRICHGLIRIMIWNYGNSQAKRPKGSTTTSMHHNKLRNAKWNDWFAFEHKIHSTHYCTITCCIRIYIVYPFTINQYLMLISWYPTSPPTAATAFRPHWNIHILCTLKFVRNAAVRTFLFEFSNNKHSIEMSACSVIYYTKWKCEAYHKSNSCLNSFRKPLMNFIDDYGSTEHSLLPMENHK